MKFLCLAYGDGKDWTDLSLDVRDRLLARDDELRASGALVAEVSPAVTTVRAWLGTPERSAEPFAAAAAPLAGFYIIDARDLDEVVRLVAETPCARAHGAIEIRAISESNDVARPSRP